MALTSICAQITSGQDNSCENLTGRKYYQQAVVINKADIEEYTINKGVASGGTTCNYNVTFNLKAGKKGYFFKGVEGGSSFFGNYDKSRNDYYYTQYLHRAQILISGVNQEAKCVLDSLDKGSFVVAMQFKDGTIEIYGLENGLSTTDYTYDPQANGGAGLIQLQSADDGQERYLPLVYKSATENGETADFDMAFEASAA